jgi:hypothetical protein
MPEDQEKVMAILNVGKAHENYLGLLTPEGRMSKRNFKSIKERLAKRFSSWEEIYMSSGAKEVLMAQAISTYVMGVFKLPATHCEELMQMIRYF